LASFAWIHPQGIDESKAFDETTYVYDFSSEFSTFIHIIGICLESYKPNELVRMLPENFFESEE